MFQIGRKEFGDGKQSEKCHTFSGVGIFERSTSLKQSRQIFTEK